MQLAADG